MLSWNAIVASRLSNRSNHIEPQSGGGVFSQLQDIAQCFSSFTCNACVQQNCTYCVELDSTSCFDHTRWSFCGRRPARNLTEAARHVIRSTRQCEAYDANSRTYSNEAVAPACPLTDDFTACQQLPCVDGRQCCKARLGPWLAHAGGLAHGGGVDPFTRGDILLKAMVAHDWVRNLSIPVHERAYTDYLFARIGPTYARAKYDVNVRVPIFRGLVDSVLTGGFQWALSPVKVDRNFFLLDGAHRIAVAMALRHSHIGISRECRGNVSVPMRATARSPINMNLPYLSKILELEGAREVRRTWHVLKVQSMLEATAPPARPARV